MINIMHFSTDYNKIQKFLYIEVKMVSFEFLLLAVSLLTTPVSSTPVCQPSHACQISNTTLRCNNLTNSSSVFIKYCPNMQIESLDLSGNNISRVVETDYQMDNAPTEVRDGESEWQEMKIDTELLVNLKHIDLSHNQLHSFPSELSNGRALKSLDLSFNKINKMNATLKMKALTLLNLENNKLQRLEENTFESYPNLHELDLSGNRLTTLKDLKLKNVKVLNVSNNQIAAIEANAFKESTQLKTLDLSHNLQTQITRSIFEGVQSSLRQLDLSNNRLRKVFSDAFSELEHLQSLDLSQNAELKNVNHIVFPYHLKTLDLKNNSLREVDECTFQHLKDIQHLNLGDNQLSCTCHIYRIYKSFGSMLYTNENSTCKNLADNVNMPIKSLHLKCLTHNCRSHDTDNGASKLNLTISVVDITIHIKWRSSFATQQFVLQVMDSSNSPVFSERIDYDREYKFESSSSFASYNICISAVNKHKEIIQKVCNIVYISDKNIIIGISAGILALLPCAILLVYIVCKDKKYKMKLLTEAPEDKLAIVDKAASTNGVGQEKHNEGFQHENTEHGPETVLKTDPSTSEDPQDIKTQSSSTHL